MPDLLLGRHGENLAREFLEKKGFTFVTANWKCKVGEIDLIMQKDGTRVLVEVKVRSSTTFGLPIETVDYRKQQKLLRAAHFYQQKVNYWDDIRFDVIGICFNKERVEIEHIEHAF